MKALACRRARVKPDVGREWLARGPCRRALGSPRKKEGAWVDLESVPDLADLPRRVREGMVRVVA